MKLLINYLRRGISWWQSKTWPSDFHNQVYYELYSLRQQGLSNQWWEKTVDRLWDWRAIRSKWSPNTKDAIRARGFQRLNDIQALYSKIIDKSIGEPIFLEFKWMQIKDFYDCLAWIKESKSPVFPSKLGHFIFPKLFIVMDHQATDTKIYEYFWQSMENSWESFAEREIAKEILCQAISNSSRRSIHENYPFEIKIIELCNIGRKHS